MKDKTSLNFIEITNTEETEI